VLREQLLPQLDVTLLDAGELDVDVLPLLVPLLTREDEIEVGGVELVLEVVQPGVQRGRIEGDGHAGK